MRVCSATPYALVARHHSTWVGSYTRFRRAWWYP